MPVDDSGTAIGPAISWMDSRGARAVRKTVRGALNVQGYGASKAAKWVRRTGGIPSLSGKDPVGHIHFLREQRPEVYAATAVFLEPVDYLNLRLTGLARASHDSITLHWVTDNRDINAIAYDDALIGLAGLERSKLPDLVPTGSVLGGLAPAAAGELGLLAGTPVIAGMGDLHSAAVGSGAVADFDAHLYIGTSSWVSCHVPFKKTDALTNIASIPSGIPGRYLVADEHETGGACLTWLRDNLLFADDALSPAARPCPPPRPDRRPTSSASSTTWRRRSPSAPTASCSRPGSTASAPRSTTTPSGAASTTSRCRRRGPTWCGPCSKASR